MKRNNVVKRFGIASLCLGVAVSAFSGITSFATDAALAEGTIGLSDLLHTQASVTQETRDVHTKKTTVTSTKCLRVSSNESYSATFKTVFNGDTSFRFAFPDDREEGVTATYGAFKFRVTDATDDTEFFDIVYQKTSNGTTMYVEWNGHTLQTYAANANAANYASANYYYDSIQTAASANVAPAFMGSVTSDQSYGTREGKLSLLWTDDVLSVTTNNTSKQDASDSITAIVAKFDGTYDETATNNGFVSKTSWGLPKMTFENGYTISFSSDFTNANTTDRGTDVSFSKITTGGTTYTFENETLTKDASMEAFDASFDTLTEANVPAQTAGKVFLGWMNTTTNELVSVYTVMRKGGYEACVLDYDTVNGASVRIAGRSGIRFQTMFDAEQYTELKEAGFIQSFGTLITYTDTLTTVGKDFTIENYQDETSFKKVENTKGVFDYTDKSGKAWKAYTLGVVDIEDYTKEYSARGYLVISYSNGVSHMVFTDYNQTDNSRSIADVANRIKTTGLDEYNAMSDQQKAIIDNYAAAYVAPQN